MLLSSIKNTGNNINVSSINNLNSSSINNSNNNFQIEIPHIKIEDFIGLVIKSVSYCLCPGLHFDSFNFIPKNNKNSNKIIHQENTELPKCEKPYCLVLDMDETLIHYFDVNF